MGKKVIWSLVSVFMVFSLVLAACAPAAAPTTPTAPATPTTPAAPTTSPTPTTPVETPTQKEAVKAVGETPKYGGQLSISQNGDPGSWVDGLGWGVSYNIMYDHLWDADWTKSIGAGNPTTLDWGANHDRYDLYTGAAGLSWEWTIDPQTDKVKIVIPIRQGIHYQQIPGNQASSIVRGRELTADDVVTNLNQRWVGMVVPVSYPDLKEPKVTRTGPWQVTVEFIGLQRARAALGSVMGVTMRAPELVKKYEDWADWKIQVATGPFMMTDYVPGSGATFIKHPSWWNRDPIGPGKGNQLPYIEKVRYSIIPDASTREAALRTGKIDHLQGFNPEGANQMRKTAPQMKEAGYYNCCTPFTLAMRVDSPPFNDIRVRHALMRATDFESLRQSLNFGKGTINSFPYSYSPPYKDLYWAHDDPELPEKVRELYIYNTEKAKQLLRDAGYPNGLKVQVLLKPTDTDYVSIFKDMWSKVGVELDFMVRESIVRDRIVTQAQHPPMVISWSTSGSANRPTELSTGNIRSVAVIPLGADTVLDAGYNEAQRMALTDYPGALLKIRQLLKDYILYQAYGIPAPFAAYSVFWWPWVKGYGGEIVTLSGKFYRWSAFTWVDPELKKKMGY